MAVSQVSPTGDQAHNWKRDMYRESNRQPFGSQAGTQSIEPQQPGLGGVLYFHFSLRMKHYIFHKTLSDKSGQVIEVVPHSLITH